MPSRGSQQAALGESRELSTWNTLLSCTALFRRTTCRTSPALYSKRIRDTLTSSKYRRKERSWGDGAQGAPSQMVSRRKWKDSIIYCLIICSIAPLFTGVFVSLSAYRLQVRDGTFLGAISHHPPTLLVHAVDLAGKFLRHCDRVDGPVTKATCLTSSEKRIKARILKSLDITRTLTILPSDWPPPTRPPATFPPHPSPLSGDTHATNCLT